MLTLKFAIGVVILTFAIWEQRATPLNAAFAAFGASTCALGAVISL